MLFLQDKEQSILVSKNPFLRHKMSTSTNMSFQIIQKSKLTDEYRSTSIYFQPYVKL